MKPGTPSNKITTQQKLFAYAYFNNKGNGTQAAIDSGYSKKTAAEQASRLLTNVKVKNLIEKLNARVEEKAIITKEEVLKEYRRIALFDLRTLYDENGAMKAIADLSDDAGAAITGIDVDEIFDWEDDKKIKIGQTVKVKLNGKIAALDSIRDTMGWKAPTKIAPSTISGEDLFLGYGKDDD